MSDLKVCLQDHLNELVRERDPYFSPQGHFYVQNYIEQTLGQLGPVKLHEFKVKARTHKNVVLKIPAKDGKQRSPIIVGAHYDGVPGTPGADDNASGVAVLLELARFFSAHPAKRPLQLIAFDLEEPGWVGSEVYAKQLVDQGEQVHLMLSLEMLGYCQKEPNTQQYPLPSLSRIYPDTGDFIALVGNIPTIPKMLRLGRAMRRSGVPSHWLPAGWKGQFLETLRRSDHAPFWDAGYPAMMVTDTAFLRNPHYHQPTDTIDTLDLDFMASVCQGLCDGLQHL